MTRLLVVLAAAAALAPDPAPGPALLVSVASSLGDVMSDIARRYEDRTGQPVRLNTAGSNFLARQIVEGARVDVFVSADDTQMDVVERAGRVVAGSRIDLLTNRLVVVGPPGATRRVSGPDDLAAPTIRRLALGNPDSVPAGVYARRWLEGAGVWTSVAPRVVPTVTVRAALAAVRSGRADLAVVYDTDARTDPEVPVLYRVPEAAAPPIRYPAAVTHRRQAAASAKFLAYLSGDEAAAIFTAAGFGLARR
ncbi:MAG: molybdate ABC transporter substrate-binding protein [Vicinamibacterales bacterium]